MTIRISHKIESGLNGASGFNTILKYCWHISIGETVVSHRLFTLNLVLIASGYRVYVQSLSDSLLRVPEIPMGAVYARLEPSDITKQVIEEWSKIVNI